MFSFSPTFKVFINNRTLIFYLLIIGIAFLFYFISKINSTIPKQHQFHKLNKPIVNNEKIKNTEEKYNISSVFKNLTKPNVFVSENERLNLTLDDLAVVTFTSSNHISEAVRSCDSFQKHPQLNSTRFIMYFDNDVSMDVRKLYADLCPVAEIVSLNLKKYPKYVQDLQQYRFKPIMEALSLQNNKLVLNIDSSVRFNETADFYGMIKDALNNNPTDVTLLRPAGHTVFSATHPMMFSFFPKINKTETSKFEQFQGIKLWVGTKQGWKAMKKFVKCALERNCMGPPGSSKFCKYSRFLDFPNKFSGCHRFDQSAINLILYEESNFQPSIYRRYFGGFIFKRDSIVV